MNRMMLRAGRKRLRRMLRAAIWAQLNPAAA
jgi:hypothetical protein